jgi:hypothetical protein
MKSIIASFVGTALVVLATTSAFASIAAPYTATSVHATISEADALRLQLALRADQGDGH